MILFLWGEVEKLSLWIHFSISGENLGSLKSEAFRSFYWGGPADVAELVDLDRFVPEVDGLEVILEFVTDELSVKIISTVIKVTK